MKENQKAEKVILNYHFNITGGDKADYFVGLPIIQFAKFDGTAFLIFENTELEEFKLQETKDKEGKLVYEYKAIIKHSKSVIKDLIPKIIKMLSNEYESLLLDWDLVGENVNEFSHVKILDEIRNNPLYFEKIAKNPILRELGYDEYYKNQQEYLRKRVDDNNEIPRKALEQYRRTAVMAILIDSFAHNISAHSLTALNWWFTIRAELMAKVEKLDSKDLEQHNSGIPPKFLSGNPLSKEIQPLIKFLLEKGAFWTSLNREHSFGGIINNLYDVLWDNFISNPLYLGSIAYSEGIKKININITIIDNRRLKEVNGFQRHKPIGKAPTNNTLLDGTLATIDLDAVFDHNKTDKEPKLQSDFIKKGKIHDELKAYLKESNIFFPNGIAGYHAFFTLLENELRNVKHHPKEMLDKMKTDGLTLNLSLEHAHLKDEKISNRLYRIGIWLKHPINISYDLLTERLSKLSHDIIDDNSKKPLLGGIYQDKICAAMLFNNTFQSVQNTETLKDNHYYPWVKSGCALISDIKENEYTDWEISWRRYSEKGKNEERRQFLKETFATPQKGYFKKFFHIWKGDAVARINENINLDWENINRFKFVAVENEEKIKEYRSKDIVRVIQGNPKDELEAYQIWLKQWLGKEALAISFFLDSQMIGRLIFNEETIKYYNFLALNKLNYEKLKPIYDKYKKKEITFFHGKANEIFDNKPKVKFYYRSHGALQAKFGKGTKPQFANISNVLAAELIETVETKICIFDNRIANRVPDRYKDFYHKNWGISIFDENEDKWVETKTDGFDKFHFLVIHLSFIEYFKNEDGTKKYSEKNIQEFIEKELLTNEKLKNRLGKNTILVITTGRGRMEWRDNLKGSGYENFVTFRAVEALIDAVESGISMNDDIDVKYNLTKILFGS
ncbi:MAG: hypothetical protein ACPG19_06050 [Saprospiraceae bacterium]